MQNPQSTPSEADYASLSIRRTIGVFETFASHKCPLSTLELSNALGCPKSSMSSILKALCDLNVLSKDRNTNTYFPSMRVASYGDWIMEAITAKADLPDLMSTLREETEETILLSLRDDLSAEVINVISGPQAISLNIVPGTRFPIWRSAVGRAMLSQMNNEKIYALINRANRSRRIKEQKVEVKALMARLKEVRECGYSCGYSEILDDVGAVAVTLPLKFSEREIVLSVGGPATRIRKKELDIADCLLAKKSQLAEKLANGI